MADNELMPVDLEQLKEAMAYRCRENSGHAVYDIVWDAARAYLATRTPPQGSMPTDEARVSALAEFMEDGRSCNECGGEDFNLSVKTYNTIIAALKSQHVVSEGWVMVPKEPTAEMWSKGRFQFGKEECRCRTAKTNEFYQTVKDTAPTEIYKAMLAAAPALTDMESE